MAVKGALTVSYTCGHDHGLGGTGSQEHCDGSGRHELQPSGPVEEERWSRASHSWLVRILPSPLLLRILLVGHRHSAYDWERHMHLGICWSFVVLLYEEDHPYVCIRFSCKCLADTRADEEEHLVQFFGKDYETYRTNTRVWIPFI